MEEKNKIEDWLELPKQLEEIQAPDGFKAKVLERIQALEPVEEDGSAVKMLDFTQWSKAWQVAAALALLIANVSVLLTYNEQKNQEKAELFAESFGGSQEDSSAFSFYE
jgi:3-oxoacyl-(acyl-carrier-protein) synthase